MNLFILDWMPVTAAQYNCDRHVVKIILEAVEMMGYAYDNKKFLPIPNLLHSSKYYNHPFSKWVRASRQNFDWAFQHTTALCDEFAYRYGHEHSYRPHVEWIGMNFPLDNLPNLGQTDFPRCFGKWKETIEISDDAVYDYRRYYMLAKRFATWRKRPTPEWYR
jgi:hypothetical protein